MEFTFIRSTPSGDVWETTDVDGDPVRGFMPAGESPWQWSDTSWFGSESRAAPAESLWE